MLDTIHFNSFHIDTDSVIHRTKNQVFQADDEPILGDRLNRDTAFMRKPFKFESFRAKIEEMVAA
jgi:hypothetical protein